MREKERPQYATNTYVGLFNWLFEEERGKRKQRHSTPQNRGSRTRKRDAPIPPVAAPWLACWALGWLAASSGFRPLSFIVVVVVLLFGLLDEGRGRVQGRAKLVLPEQPHDGLRAVDRCRRGEPLEPRRRRGNCIFSHTLGILESYLIISSRAFFSKYLRARQQAALLSRYTAVQV